APARPRVSSGRPEPWSTPVGARSPRLAFFPGPEAGSPAADPSPELGFRGIGRRRRRDLGFRAQERCKFPRARSILNPTATTADEYPKIMKAPQQHRKPTDTEAKVKHGGDKLHCLKPGKYTNKSSGNIGAKCRREDGQLFTGSKIALKGGSFMEVPFSNSTNLSAQPPNYSKKMKLQFFPIDEAIQKVLQQEKHNPYLELTLAPRKKMSSIVQHLNTKWGRSSCAKGELMLFPYGARPDSLVGSEKWTVNDSCTAADVYVAVGSPSTFRLRYGWFEHNLKQQSSEESLAPVHSAEKTIGDKPSDHFVFPNKPSDPFEFPNKPLDPFEFPNKPSDPFEFPSKHSDPFEFPSKFTSPSDVCNTEQTVVDNQSKVTPLSWIDCISNISFGALLSQAVPSQDSKQPPLQSSSILQQIPATCDSFDAAIASLIAHQQTSNQPKVSNPSVWDAEETCHAFPRNQTSARMFSSAHGNSSAITSSILGAIPESDTDGNQVAVIPLLL
uniref:TSL-kinase interacting protein 1 n=1 Tax=Aegilops tauschii subsp. strangulata TaxID=200361 RepID=A0A453E8H7_AEGTS